MNRLKKTAWMLALMLCMAGTGSIYVSASGATEKEVREDASRTGLTESTTQAAAQGITTESDPVVVVPRKETPVTAPEVDTTRGMMKITIEPDKKDWYNDSARLNVRAEKISTKAPATMIVKVECRIGASGSWQDITDDMFFEVTENCTVYVRVTDQYGNEYEKSRLIKVFDTVAPTLNAAVNEGLLTVMTYDTESGVDSVYVNGYKFVPDQNGIVSIRLQKFDATYRNFYVYAVDQAGNTSQINTILNPYWTDPYAETDDSGETKNPAEDLPDNASANTTGTSSAEVTAVTDEDGEDITDQVRGKQFYSIVTSDGQQYFLVIDMTAAQSRGGDNENAAYTGTKASAVNNSPNTGTVYFLTSVSNRNLLNFVNDGEQTLPHNSVAAPNSIDPDAATPVSDGLETTEEKTEETEKEPEKQESSGGIREIMLWAGLFIVIVVIVVLFKSSGRKKGKPEQNDDSLYDDSADEDYGEERIPLDELNETDE